LHAARGRILALLAGVSADDNIVELENCLHAALSLVARQNTKLDVIHVVERFTGAHEPRRRLVETESVDRLDWKVTEEHLRGKLVSANSLREEEQKLRIKAMLPSIIECERRDEIVAVESFQRKL